MITTYILLGNTRNYQKLKWEKTIIIILRKTKTIVNGPNRNWRKKMKISKTQYLRTCQTKSTPIDI